MFNATIVKRTEVTNDLIIIAVKPDAGVPTFKAGQYVALGLPEAASSSGKEKLVKRAYSIGSSPEQKEYIEFFFAVVPNGELTPKLAKLREGDRLFMAPKIVGTFTLDDVPNNANLVFVSTGTGIAPFMAMLRTGSVWTADRKITLVHGVRYAPDLAYVEELQSYAAKNPCFKYLATVSRPDASWKGEKGYVHRFFENGIVAHDPAIDHVFACGNPAMIEDLEKMLLAKSYVVHERKIPGSLHLEKYW